MLAYAAADTSTCSRCGTRWSKDSWNWEPRLAQEEFKQLEALRWTGPAAAGEKTAILRLKGAKGLAAQSGGATTVTSLAG